MNPCTSEHFVPIPLAAYYNARRDMLPSTLSLAPDTIYGFGAQSFLGIPFLMGPSDGENVILLDKEEIRIDLGSLRATYLMFLHAVEDRRTKYLEGFADDATTGHELGDLVSEYSLEYDDGPAEIIPVFRRVEIQQSHVAWGANPFAAVSALKPLVLLSSSEYQALGRVPPREHGVCVTRVVSSYELTREHLWIYALPNPFPERQIRQLVCAPRRERSLIYAVSYTSVGEHPLRPGRRETLLVALPPGSQLNSLGELDGIDLDLGVVISARRKLGYDRDGWLGGDPDSQPATTDDSVLVEVSAHPQSKLYLKAADGSVVAHDIGDPSRASIIHIEPAVQPVRLRVIEGGSDQPVPVRLHLHGPAGEYLPPKGRHRKVNSFWNEDHYGEFVNGLNQYCYIAGECVVDLPRGEVFIEAYRGLEVTPIRRSFKVGQETREVTFQLERSLNWRKDGWVSADTHVHFLSPQTALLEGSAEGVNVVNLLASQWGELYTNVTDFDGRTTLGAREFGGSGEFLVRVGTENRMQVLGHISLLGYKGQMILPLCTGGPSESAVGDAQEVSVAEWARRCREQNGLVVLPHAPSPQAERAADIVMGLIDGIEMDCENPYKGRLNPYGIADWYRYLNLGYLIPVVGGTDKMSAAMLLGGCRTYANLGDLPFTYENWMTAVKKGNTFVTIGPLVLLQVEGMPPGSTIRLPKSGGTVSVSWKVESTNVPVHKVELIVGGKVCEDVPGPASKPRMSPTLMSGGTRIDVKESTWIAVRVRGSYRGITQDVAAHTSAVQVLVDDTPLFSELDAVAVLEQIEGSMAYLDTIATRGDVVMYQRLLSTLEAARNHFHNIMHRHGIFHETSLRPRERDEG
jgi:hypothetical protein